jgi:hypothetical protein
MCIGVGIEQYGVGQDAPLAGRLPNVDLPAVSAGVKGVASLRYGQHASVALGPVNPGARADQSFTNQAAWSVIDPSASEDSRTHSDSVTPEMICAT